MRGSVDRITLEWQIGLVVLMDGLAIWTRRVCASVTMAAGACGPETGASETAQMGESADSGGPASGECVFADGGCPEGCELVYAFEYDESCEVVAGLPACVDASDDDAVDRSWWRDAAGTLEYYQRLACSDAVHPGEGWTECTGGAADPPGCACGCIAGVCAGARALDTLDECTVTAHCGDYMVNASSEDLPAPSVGECIFAGLRDGTSLRFGFTSVYPDGASYREAYSSGDGSLVVVSAESSTPDCGVTDWTRPASRCQLDADVVASCAMNATSQCYELDAMLTACESIPILSC